MFDAAVVLVVGGPFLGVVLFAPLMLWVVGKGIVLRAEETTKK